MDIIKVGQAISYLRKRAGYTQKELADRIGISDKAVSKWERGQGLPEIGYLRKLSILLDTDSDSLLTGNVFHHDNGWQGILILDDNENDIGAGTIIFDKPLIYFLLSYYMLVGIRTINIICGENNRNWIERNLGDGSAYGVQIHCCNSLSTIDPEDAQNMMIIHGRCVLYGVEQTRFFLRAMAEKDRLSVLALPQKSRPIHVDSKLRILDANKPKALRKQYDYSKLPVFFMPASYFSGLSSASSVTTFLDNHEVFVEMMDRGFIEIEINDWNDVQDASLLMKIIQDKCGMNVYCLEEVAWRRGLISLEQLKKLGERNNRTEYGAYVLSIYERMRTK